MRNSPDRCPLHKHIRSQAPFLPACSAVRCAGRRRRYPASQVLRACPPPHTARTVPHGLPVCVRRTGRPVGGSPPPLGLPACLCRRQTGVASDLLVYVLRHYPGGTVGCSRCLLPQRRRPSPFASRVGSRITFFEACSAFTLVFARILAESPGDPLHRRLRRRRFLRPRSDCFRLW